ncbi:MAG: DMT family transporter [Rhodocyclaceae bacterium]|nr:DMT family transporter [Rhodocyclaceae bacterium]
MARLVTYVKLVATMAAWGGTWVAGRAAVAHVAPLAVGVWRYLFATLSLFMLLWWRRRFIRLDRRETGIVLAMAISGIFLYNLFFLYGMRDVTAGRGALVVAITPILTMWLAAWLLHEGLDAMKILGSALASLGCLTVIGHGDPLAPLQGEIGSGDLLILGCAAAWTVYTLLGRLGTETLEPLTMTAYASTAGFLMLLLLALWREPAALWPAYPFSAWVAIAFLGFLGTTLGFTWFSSAVQEIGAQRASVFINLVPLVAVFAGAWLLDEPLDVSMLVGGACAIGGVWLAQQTQQKERSR